MEIIGLYIYIYIWRNFLNIIMLLILQITNKLSGKDAKTALWATSVGNEFGQILNCVLTAAEGAGLKIMAEGIMKR